MRLPDHERAAHREAFRSMTLGQKAEYIFAYYKLPLVLAFIAIVAAGSVASYLLTHKDPVLYLAYANVDIPEERDDQLAAELMDALDANAATQEVYRYRALYLSAAEETADHQYSYASRMKLLAAVDAQQLDVVFMNRESYDLLSADGFLLDMREALQAEPALMSRVEDRIESNVVVLSDNKLEVELGEADEYVADTVEVDNALRITDALLPEGEMTGDVYVGIIANSPRVDAALELISLLV